MKKSFTKLLGALLCALFFVPNVVQATVTATWDWASDSPSGIRAATNYQSNTGYVNSNQTGIHLYVDASAGKFAYSSGNTCIQMNANTEVRVPVVSSNDIVTINFLANAANCTINDVACSSYPETHKATKEEVEQGYVKIGATNTTWINSISVELAYTPPTDIVVKWDWENNIPDGIQTFTTIQNNSGTIDSNVSGYSLSVDATSGKLGANGGNPQCTAGTKLRVPVTATTDVVTVKFHPYNFANGTIGGEAYSTTTTQYTAKLSDVSQGYVEIVSGGEYIYSVILKKSGSATATIGTTGWATFSNTAATDFTNLAGVVDAYQVTGNSEKAITKSAVTTAAANTGLLLNAEEGTYAIPLAATGADLSGTNKLVAVATLTSVGAAESGYTNYVLVASGTSAVFQYISGTNATVAAGKAYLKLNISAPASRELLAIDGDATGIQNIKVGTEDNVYYDLQGRRVLYPKKGLYIVNGKKVILK